MTPRIHDEYKKEVVPALMKKFGYENVMMVPRIDKISVNIGVGEANQSPNLMEDAVKPLRQITGQQPSVRLAKQPV